MLDKIKDEPYDIEDEPLTYLKHNDSFKYEKHQFPQLQ